jgi:Holliday junction resolvasome RuvABC endonuclease subunit
MRIMGVDPSITRTGISLPDGTTVVVKPKDKGDDRLMEIADYVRVLSQANLVDLVVMEDAPTRLLGDAGRVLLHLQGAVRLELKRLPVPYMILSPSTLKKFATGNGSADKTAMALAAFKRLGREYGTDDECDADWLRVAGRFAYGLGEYLNEPRAAGGRIALELPKVQLEALRWAGTGKKRHEIVWPVVGGRAPWPGVTLRA